MTADASAAPAHMTAQGWTRPLRPQSFNSLRSPVFIQGPDPNTQGDTSIVLLAVIGKSPIIVENFR